MEETARPSVEALVIREKDFDYQVKRIREFRALLGAVSASLARGDRAIAEMKQLRKAALVDIPPLLRAR